MAEPRLIGEVARRRLEARMSDGPCPEEFTYRRAYNHAVEEMLRHVRDGATVAELTRWADAVEEWREQGWRRGEASPPTFRRGA